MTRQPSKRPPETALSRRSRAFVKATAEKGREHEKTRIHLYLWPADLVRIDAMILGRGGWGSRHGVLARILSIGLPIMEAEVAARRNDPACQQERTANETTKRGHR